MTSAKRYAIKKSVGYPAYWKLGGGWTNEIEMAHHFKHRDYAELAAQAMACKKWEIVEFYSEDV